MQNMRTMSLLFIMLFFVGLVSPMEESSQEELSCQEISESEQDLPSLLIFIPTYNERENVRELWNQIKETMDEVALRYDVLFCDDNSEDGTGDELDALAEEYESITVIHRPRKMGLGTAHCYAFTYALDKKYDYLVTMDADFYHPPYSIPSLIEKAEQAEADIVIGSRFLEGSDLVGAGKVRSGFTHLWRGMIEHGLHMPYDSTGAFRLYRVSILDHDLESTIKATGFAFNLEVLHYLMRKGATITEVPIITGKRIYGKSKLSGNIIIEMAATYIKLFLNRSVKQGKKG